MARYRPLFSGFSSYKRSYFGKDALAGLTVGIVLIPQGMAYAMIAGLPPVYGLYAALLPLLVYALLGTSRQLGVGPVAMDSLLVASGLGTLAITGVENYVALAILLTFMVGTIQCTLGLLRMGFLVNFLSRPVISGFTSAAAIIIFFSQIKHLLGTNTAQSNHFHIIFNNTFRDLHTTNIPTLFLGLGGIALILVLRKWNDKIPGFLIAVVLGISATVIFGLDAKGIKVVGAIPSGLPSFRLPAFGWEPIRTLFPMAFALAVIGYTEAISIGQSISEKNREDGPDANKELLALGSANLIGSFFRSYPVTASFSRSAINHKMGAKTQWSGVVAVALVALTLVFLTPLFYYLPDAVLAAIIIISVAGLIEVRYPAFLWEHQRDEFWVLLVTFLITLFIGIQDGILLGVLLSLILMVYRTSKPHFVVLGKIQGTGYYKNVERFRDDVEVRDDILIVRFDSQLYFGNKNFFRETLYKFMQEKGSGLRCIILSAEAVNYIDSSATAMLVNLIRDLEQQKIEFYVSGAPGPTRDVIFHNGIIEILRKEHLFLEIQEAVDYIDNRQAISPAQGRIAYQNKPFNL